MSLNQVPTIKNYEALRQCGIKNKVVMRSIRKKTKLKFNNS